MNHKKLKKLRFYIKAQLLVVSMSRDSNGFKRYSKSSNSKVAFLAFFIGNQQL